MAKGNKEAYKNFPLYDTSDTNIEENAILCQYALDVFNAKEPDLNNPDEVEIAINNYFNNCISKGLRPGNLGLYASLGLDKDNVKNLIQGRIKSVNGKSVNPASIAHLKKAKKALATFREMLGAQGKINPVTLLFWQKNYDGLTDVHQIEIDANSAPKPDLSPDEIVEKIEKDIPIDAEYNELS